MQWLSTTPIKENLKVSLINFLMSGWQLRPHGSLFGGLLQTKAQYGIVILAILFGWLLFLFVADHSFSYWRIHFKKNWQKRTFFHQLAASNVPLSWWWMDETPFFSFMHARFPVLTFPKSMLSKNYNCLSK